MAFLNDQQLVNFSARGVVKPLDLKLVSVKFEAFGFVFPTLYLGFYVLFSLVNYYFVSRLVQFSYLEVFLLLLLFLGTRTHSDSGSTVGQVITKTFF